MAANTPPTSLNLFRLGQRGVNTVTAPTHLTDDELTEAINAEIVPVSGDGGIDKRPGMSLLSTQPLNNGGNILCIHDVPSLLRSDLTPTLYVGLYAGQTHNWRTSTDGTTWINNDILTKPWSNNPYISSGSKQFPKVVTLGNKLYFPDGSTPIGIHKWDGVADSVITTIPPAVSGTNLAVPVAPIADFNGVVAGTTYSYVVVAVAGTAHSAASATGSTTFGPAALTAGKPIEIRLGTPVAGGQYYDIYRTVGGATQGKIGTIPIVSTSFTYGNGSQIAPSPVIDGNVFNVGTAGATTYSYVIVKFDILGHNSDPSATFTTTTGNAALSVANYNNVVGSFSMRGGESLSMWRTAGGATQGLIISGNFTGIFHDTGLTGDGTSPPATFSGTAADEYPYVFADAGLVGDGSTAPTVSAGVTTGDPQGVLDFTTDGTSLIVSVQDLNPADPTVDGRLLTYNPSSNFWSQVGAAFPTAAGNGSASAAIMYDGALTYGTYIGITSGNTSYVKSTGTPLPAGGFPETHTTAASQSTCCIASFKGNLYVGYASLVAATAAIVAKRVPIATWSTSLTASGTGAQNAFTNLYVFNGRLYAAWQAGATAAHSEIYVTVDGINWTLELTAGINEIIYQMVGFGADLYVVTGTRILKRNSAGTWTAQDTGTYAGCIGIAYV